MKVDGSKLLRFVLVPTALAGIVAVGLTLLPVWGARAPDWQQFQLGPGLLVAFLAVCVLHEFVHLVFLAMAGASRRDLSVRPSLHVLRIEFTRPIARQAFVPVALGPLVFLSALLLVPTFATGEAAWIFLTACHVGACSEDLRAVSSSRRRPDDTGFGAGRARWLLLALLVLPATAALAASRVPTSRWLCAEQIVPFEMEVEVAAPDGVGVAEAASRRAEVSRWGFRVDDASRLVVHWSERLGSAAPRRAQLEFDLPTTHGVLRVELGRAAEGTAGDTAERTAERTAFAVSEQGRTLVSVGVSVEGGPSQRLATFERERWEQLAIVESAERQVLRRGERVHLLGLFADERVDQALEADAERVFDGLRGLEVGALEGWSAQIEVELLP